MDTLGTTAASIPGGLASARGNAGTRLRDALGRLGVHDHLCLIYETPEQHLAAATTFLQQGLRARERCLYVADDASPARVRAALQQSGIDVAAAEREGTLAVITKREAYLRTGRFDVEGMNGFWVRAAREAHDAGFRAVRAAAEMTWALGGDPGSERLVEYEAGLNDLFPKIDASAVCQYNRRRFPAATLVEMVRTHPVVVYGDLVARNFFYVPPAEYFGPEAAETELARLLDNLVAREAQEEERAQARERQRELESLQELDATRATFLAAAAHELGNPITPIRIHLELLRRSEHVLGDKERESLAAIERGVSRLATLAEEVLDVTRIEAGQLELQVARTDLAALVREVAGSFEPMAREQGVAIEVRGPARLTVEADPSRLTQVAFNLVRNALKYTPAGGRVVLETAQRGGEAVVTVRDTGLGLRAEDIPLLFKPFARLDSGKGPRGNGLGLFVCDLIIKGHGGRIWAESEGLGKGSTFGFALRSSTRLPAA